jgi:hypothetical protein
MKKKRPSNDMLLNRALRVAAIEAYHSEVVETGMYDTTIGTGKAYPTVDMWIQDRIAHWMEEADLNTKNGE